MNLFLSNPRLYNFCLFNPQVFNVKLKTGIIVTIFVTRRIGYGGYVGHIVINGESHIITNVHEWMPLFNSNNIELLYHENLKIQIINTFGKTIIGGFYYRISLLDVLLESILDNSTVFDLGSHLDIKFEIESDTESIYKKDINFSVDEEGISIDSIFKFVTHCDFKGSNRMFVKDYRNGTLIRYRDYRIGEHIKYYNYKLLNIRTLEISELEYNTEPKCEKISSLNNYLIEVIKKIVNMECFLVRNNPRGFRFDYYYNNMDYYYNNMDYRDISRRYGWPILYKRIPDDHVAIITTIEDGMYFVRFLFSFKIKFEYLYLLSGEGPLEGYIRNTFGLNPVKSLKLLSLIKIIKSFKCKNSEELEIFSDNLCSLVPEGLRKHIKMWTYIISNNFGK